MHQDGEEPSSKGGSGQTGTEINYQVIDRQKCQTSEMATWQGGNRRNLTSYVLPVKVATHLHLYTNGCGGYIKETKY